MKKTVVLAFSGGLDTSYCIPALMEQGFDVVTLFVDTGGADMAERARIRDRAIELGARDHVVADAGEDLWTSFCIPFLWGGAPYQGQYPLLCSDRYVIAERLVAAAIECGADAIAHGCTAMGNDQVRLDQSLRCLTALPILAPIRDLQGRAESPRAFEIKYLRDRGFSVDDTVRRYTINENLLGATISGAEIDRYESPELGTYRLTRPREDWPEKPLRTIIRFEEGRAVALDEDAMSGPALLRRLNDLFGAYGVGRGMYTGDTVIGLKGRIVFEAPGLTALLVAHRALEECALTARQLDFKTAAARRWTDLVYSGLFHEPLRVDLEALLRSSQHPVSGSVTLETSGGACHATAIDTPHHLIASGATYAQSADWSKEDAVGFIKLFGLSSATAARRSSEAQTVKEWKPTCSAVSCRISKR